MGGRIIECLQLPVGGLQFGGPHRQVIADVPLTNLHQLTFLAYLIHPAGCYVRSKFDSNAYHVILSGKDQELRLGLAKECISNYDDSAAIIPILIFGNPEGDSNFAGVMLDPCGAGGLLATDILNHLGEDRCRCQICENILNNTCIDPLLHRGRVACKR